MHCVFCRNNTERERRALDRGQVRTPIDESTPTQVDRSGVADTGKRREPETALLGSRCLRSRAGARSRTGEVDASDLHRQELPDKIARSSIHIEHTGHMPSLPSLRASALDWFHTCGRCLDDHGRVGADAVGRPSEIGSYETHGLAGAFFTTPRGNDPKDAETHKLNHRAPNLFVPNVDRACRIDLDVSDRVCSARSVGAGQCE